MGTGPGGTNRSLARLRAVYNWAIPKKLVKDSPFKFNGVVVVKREDEPARSRRLKSDQEEEARLLAACGPHLRAVVEAALATGMRSGEILSLQWHQVEGIQVDDQTVTWAPRAEIFLPAKKTKTKRDRRVPISTRLKGILEMRRLDPNGKPFPASAFTFGNFVGQQIQHVTRAWYAAVLRAYGHTPAYTDKANLTPDCRAALADIDLHFHDLRREAGSRWMDGGIPLGTVQRWLGHKNISQTSTYLSGTPASDHDALRQYEDRLASLQELATAARKGGRKSPRAAKRREKTPNETAGGRHSAIM
jgi:integrase